MTRDEALVWLAGIFDEPAEKVRPETPRDEIFGWDSMGMLTLMADIDEKFNIRLGAKDLKDMTKVQDVLNMLEQHGVFG